MDYTAIIEAIISLAASMISNLKLQGAPPEVIAEVQAALDAWLAVRGSAVTYNQLESLRTKSTF